MLKQHIMLFEEHKASDLSFKSLMANAPDNLVDYIETLKMVQQRPDKHPEGSVYIHTQVVVDRLSKFNDINLSLAGIFHDNGKDRTTKTNPDTGYPMSPGHEKYSAQVVLIFATWIKEMGGNVNTVHSIVLNHMKMKGHPTLSKKQLARLKMLPEYDMLVKFNSCDYGGTDNASI